VTDDDILARISVQINSTVNQNLKLIKILSSVLELEKKKNMECENSFTICIVVL